MARSSKVDSGISRISVEGYKSLYTRQALDIKPLTIMAGINSSGKSSFMQPLLLIKQSLEASYDSGPLQLDGPNVSVTSIEQVLSRGQGGDSQVKSFEVGVTIDDVETALTYGKGPKGDLRVLKMIGPHPFAPDRGRIEITEGLTSEEIRARIPGRLSFRLISAVENIGAEIVLQVARERSFLVVTVKVDDFFFPIVGHDSLAEILTSIIHLPALRGNPKRAYRATAVWRALCGTI